MKHDNQNETNMRRTFTQFELNDTTINNKRRRTSNNDKVNIYPYTKIYNSEEYTRQNQLVFKKTGDRVPDKSMVTYESKKSRLVNGEEVRTYKNYILKKVFFYENPRAVVPPDCEPVWDKEKKNFYLNGKLCIKHIQTVSGNKYYKGRGKQYEGNLDEYYNKYPLKDLPKVTEEKSKTPVTVNPATPVVTPTQDVNINLNYRNVAPLNNINFNSQRLALPSIETILTTTSTITPPSNKQREVNLPPIRMAFSNPSNGPLFFSSAKRNEPIQSTNHSNIPNNSGAQ